MAVKRLATLALLGVMGGSLGACSGNALENVFGYGKNPPDEFAIVTKAPLIIPPDYTLRPPRPGAIRPQDLQPRNTAASAVFSTGSVNTANLEGSPGEQALLIESGAANADPEIRSVINREVSSIEDKSDTFTDTIIFWEGEGEQEPALVIDPVAENERIQRNQAEGNPVTQGETPVVESTTPEGEPEEEEGFFDSLF